jgi:hypothetical protein
LNKDKIYLLDKLSMSKLLVIKYCGKWKENIIMVRSAKDVPGLKILNSPPSAQNSSNNVFAINTHNAKQVVTSGKENMTSSSSTSNNSK